MRWIGLCGIITILLASALIWWPTEKNRNLRGSFVPSKDRKTYLVIEDDNGGGCGKILIDGSEWKYKIGQTGVTTPGGHQIQCDKGDSGIGFTIPEGTVFRFDYWGP